MTAPCSAASCDITVKMVVPVALCFGRTFIQSEIEFALLALNVSRYGTSASEEVHHRTIYHVLTSMHRWIFGLVVLIELRLIIFHFFYLIWS